MKKIVKKFLEASFVISLTLLGKFELESFELIKYQIVVTVFLMSGILKFMNSESNIKESILDSAKDLIISITIIPLWYWISGSVENELFEPITIMIYYITLMFILYVTQCSVKLSGSIAYYTNATIPVIAIILIRLGIPLVFSVIIAGIIPEPINYLYYKKKRINNAKHD